MDVFRRSEYAEDIGKDSITHMSKLEFKASKKAIVFPKKKTVIIFPMQ